LLGGGIEESERLLRAWLDTVTMTHNEVDVAFLTTITGLNAFAQKVLLLSSFDGTPAALGAMIDGETSPRTDLFELSNSKGGLSSLAYEVKPMTRENRLTVIEKIIADIRGSRSREIPDRFNADLISGYLLSLIDPGSIDYIDVALSLDGSRGYVAAAYSMCAGLMGGDKFLWKYDGFGLTVVSSDRWKTDSVLGSSPDLSLDELRVLKNRVSATGFDFRTRNPALVEVELVPDVTGCFQNGARRESSPPRIDNLAAIRLDRIDKLVNELKDAVDEFRDDLRLPRSTGRKRRSQKII
jgi:hypothetical protein